MSTYGYSQHDVEKYREQKLNKKLVEWIGWEYMAKESCDVEAWGKLLWNVDKWAAHPLADGSWVGEGYWLSPNGEHHYTYPENLTQSLDACFKWFKHKFISMACGSLYEEGWKGAWAKVITHSRETSDVREEGIEPALALCLAMEKLIDER